MKTLKDLKKYNEFVDFLNSLNTVEEKLYYVYQYFRDFVSYDYDNLQLVKIVRSDDKKLAYIQDFANKTSRTPFNKRRILEMLDNLLYQQDGTILSDGVIDIIFKNYELEDGNALNFDLNNSRFYNGLLQKGICSDYAQWINKLCNDIGLTSCIVYGYSSTAHAWNVVYDPDNKKWINFDMTMVEFCNNNFAGNFYKNAEKWAFASTKEMFLMQPKRKIVSLSTGKVFFPPIDYSNYSLYLESLNSECDVKKKKFKRL